MSVCRKLLLLLLLAGISRATMLPLLLLLLQALVLAWAAGVAAPFCSN